MICVSQSQGSARGNADDQATAAAELREQLQAAQDELRRHLDEAQMRCADLVLISTHPLPASISLKRHRCGPSAMQKLKDRLLLP